MEQAKHYGSEAMQGRYYNWPQDMDQLLTWMRGENMSYEFCAGVISREAKRYIGKGACLRRDRTLRGVR